VSVESFRSVVHTVVRPIITVGLGVAFVYQAIVMNQVQAELGVLAASVISWWFSDRATGSGTGN
jgi:hypothetical protein